MFPIKGKILKNEKGASAVEFALILIPLIILIFAIFEFGILFNNYIALTHAAREGARLAAVGEDELVIKEKIIDRAPSVEIEDEDINIEGMEGEIGDPVTVTVRGKVINFKIPFISQKSFSLASSATLRIEWKSPLE